MPNNKIYFRKKKNPPNPRPGFFFFSYYYHNHIPHYIYPPHILFYIFLYLIRASFWSKFSRNFLFVYLICGYWSQFIAACHKKGQFDYIFENNIENLVHIWTSCKGREFGKKVTEHNACVCQCFFWCTDIHHIRPTHIALLFCMLKAHWSFFFAVIALQLQHIFWSICKKANNAPACLMKLRKLNGVFVSFFFL